MNNMVETVQKWMIYFLVRNYFECMTKLVKFINTLTENYMFSCGGPLWNFKI